MKIEEINYIKGIATSLDRNCLKFDKSIFQNMIITEEPYRSNHCFVNKFFKYEIRIYLIEFKLRTPIVAF